LIANEALLEMLVVKKQVFLRRTVVYVLSGRFPADIKIVYGGPIFAVEALFKFRKPISDF
jgi:hypothetical protein